MTQNTQTTAQRILTILRDHLEFYAGSGEWAAATEAGEQIAAEIDALTAERDEAQRLIGIYGTSRDAVIAQLGTEIDRLTAERDEAAKYRDQYVRECGELTAQLAEAERLRPAAEAWRRMGELHKMGWSAEYSMTQARKLGEEDAARDAKERKP